MQLAKPHLDLGLFTNSLEPMLAFYQQEVGLPFDHMLPIGRGIRQHRHDMMGSVLKINHAREPLPAAAPSGYRELLIAREGLAAPQSLRDPDGNGITLVPPDHCGIKRIGLRLAVRDLAAHRRFFDAVLGLPGVPGQGDDAFLVGDSVILLAQDRAATVDPVMDAPGFRYVTIQVLKVDVAHAAILKAGGREGRAPRTLGETARISFVRDPDGNWIEISQRASITGSLT